MIPSTGAMNLLVWVSAFASVSLADSLIERSSFGHSSRISPSRDSISGWRISGEGHVPELLSDRIILTPPYPGHKRGALWTEDTNLQSEWTAQFEFRANGEERGSGNLQLWYVKDGSSKVGTSSIYTVGPFDGFALTVDVHGGKGGSIRGFLNDGSTDYKSHTSVDSLAFGHCDYSYRNLGRPSKVQIKQTQSEFEVTVDQKLCFKTNKVSLPSGNNFGITAASAENPDSFEIFRFILASIGSNKPVQNQDYYRGYDRQYIPPGRDPAQSAGNQNLDAQFASLQQSIQALNAAADKLGPELSGKIDNRHQELLRSIPDKNAIAGLEQRLQRVENMLSNLQKDVQKMDYSNQFRSLQDALKTSHSGLLENFQTSSNQILSSAPRMGMFIFLIIAFQLALAGSYVLYKRRRANMPKKFL